MSITPDHEHREITTLVLAVQNLTENQTELSSDVKELVKSMSKQELILEKLANLEINSKESLNRVHKRVNKLETDLAKVSDTCLNSGCAALAPHKEICKTNHDVLAKRLDTNDTHKTWLVLTILTTVVGSIMSLILIKGN